MKGVEIGDCWQNKKTGGIYQVLLITRNSELATQYRVVYHAIDVNPTPETLWDRPLDLFLVKFKRFSKPLHPFPTYKSRYRAPGTLSSIFASLWVLLRRWIRRVLAR